MGRLRGVGLRRKIEENKDIAMLVLVVGRNGVKRELKRVAPGKSERRK